MKSNKLFNVAGSKERLFEMMQKVNKVKLNEDFGGNPETDNSTDLNILEKSFNELKSDMLRIKRTNTQTEGGETFLELICFSQQGSDTVFRFKIEASEDDQDGVLSVNNAELISLISDEINIPEGSVALQQFNAQHKSEIIDIVSEYADISSEEPEMDEEYQKAVEKIDSYPFTSKPRTMVTSKQYGDEKPTNPALRVKSPQLDKFVDEGAEHERYSSYSQDINSRLKAFADSHGENWVDLKNEFMREADPYNMKSPKDQQDAYFEIVDDFLSKNGMNEGNVTINNPYTANLGKHYFDKASSARKIKAIQDAVKFYEEQGVTRNSMPPDKYMEMLKHTAELIFTGNIAALNEEKKKSKKKASEYPDQIGSHFKPKSDYPVEKKKPTKVVSIDENDEIPEPIKGVRNPLGTKLGHAKYAADVDMRKHYNQKIGNTDAVYPNTGEEIPSELWNKHVLPNDTKFDLDADYNDDGSQRSAGNPNIDKRYSDEDMWNVQFHKKYNRSMPDDLMYEGELPDDRVSDMGTGEKLNIGDVVTVDGLIGEYQVGVKHSEGKPFLMPFDMGAKKASPQHRIYLTTLNNPKLTKVLSYADTNGGFMSESIEEKEPSSGEEAEIDNIEHDREEHGEKLVGGKGDDATPQEFDQEQVLMGLKVEMEHTDDPTVALEIVLDHLSEDPEYYTTKDDPECSAQANAAKDADEMSSEEPNWDKMDMSVPDDKEQEDILLGFKPHNVGDDLDEETGYEEYQGNVGDRYADKDNNEFTVSGKVKGGVGLRGQGGSKEVATSDVMKMRKLGTSVEEAYGQPDPLKIPMLPKDNRIR